MDGDECEGEICDIAYSEDEGPVWEGSIACYDGTYDLSVSLARDEYSGECVLLAVVNDEELDPVTISGCGVSIAATFELYDGTIIEVEAGIGRWVKAAFSDKVFDQSFLCRMQPARQIACQFRRGSEPVFRPDPSRLEGCVVVIVALGSDGSARGPGRIGGPVSQRNRTPASSAGDGVLSGLRSADALR